MKKRFAVTVLALSLFALPAISAHAQQYGPPQGPPPPPPGAYNNNGPQGPQWDREPEGFTEFRHRGFRDGIEAARMDMEARRPMDPHRSRMYRRPPVPRNVRGEYREGFDRGYQMSMQHHMMNRGQDRDHDRPYNQ